jgi:hypothetical protein
MTTSRRLTTARDRPPEEAADDTSFARGMRLLLTVAERGEIRADELSSLLAMPVSTVYRYLRTLVDFGIVDRQGGQFRLGSTPLIGTGASVRGERLIRQRPPPEPGQRASTAVLLSCRGGSQRPGP